MFRDVPNPSVKQDLLALFGDYVSIVNRIRNIKDSDQDLIGQIFAWQKKYLLEDLFIIQLIFSLSATDYHRLEAHSDLVEKIISRKQIQTQKILELCGSEPIHADIQSRLGITKNSNYNPWFSLSKEDRYHLYDSNNVLRSVFDDDIRNFTKYIQSQGPNFDWNREYNCKTLIEWACKYGANNIFRYLVLNKIPISQELVPLACSGGNIKIVKTLLRNLNNEYIPTQLCINAAAEFHHNEVAGFLEDLYGLLPTYESTVKYYNIEYFFHRASHLINLSRALPYSTRFHSTQIVNFFLRTNGRPSAVTKKNESAICTACSRFDQSATVQLLLDNGTSVITQDIYGNTPLHIAAKHGASKIANLLISNGVKVNVINSLKMTALMYAAESNSVQIARMLLIEHADVSITDINGRNAFMYCACKDAVDIARPLFAKGIDINSKDNDGNTALHLCAVYNSYQFALFLVEIGADATIKNLEGKTPYKVAQEKTGINPDLLELLKKALIPKKK